MATVTEDDKKEMTVEYQAHYCNWCFFHDIGLCHSCALEKDFMAFSPSVETPVRQTLAER
jgi:hypothetical protein